MNARPILVQRPPISAGLLTAPIADAGDSLVLALGAAYAAILTDKAENFKRWHQTRGYVTRSLQDRYNANGLTAPPLVWDAFWARIDLPVPGADALAHVRLVQALTIDYGPRLCEHILYRLAHEGNVHLSFRGPTGLGKSSCAISLANWIRAIAPDRLHRHLSFDLTELPSKLADKQAGETVIQDEYTHGVGEGATTMRLFFENLEDTLRASQVNLFRLSPREQDRGTMQAELELVLWCPERAFSLFLVWLDGVSMGVVAIPWAPPALYDAYRPWKKANVERSRAGQFKDRAFIAKIAVRLFADDRLVYFLTEGVNKPAGKDFRMALELFHGEMLATAQVDKLVAFMVGVCNAYDRIGPHFEEWFGVKPNEGLEKVARRCYAA